MKWYANEKMMKAIKKMDLNLSDQNKASDNEKKSTDEKLEEMKVQNEVQEVLEEIEAVEPEETVETISATVEEKMNLLSLNQKQRSMEILNVKKI